MKIAYLLGDEEITAESVNVLAREMDRKMSLALDGKSWFLFTGTSAGSPSGTMDPQLVGAVFAFVGSSPVYSQWFASYDHSIFTAAAAAATEVSRDEARRIMTVYGMPLGFLDGSLEAHKRAVSAVDGVTGETVVTNYYLQGAGGPGTEGVADLTPERRHDLAVADLVYEGPNFQRVDWPVAWDKYNCFRIHNLNSYPIVWRVVEAQFEVTVPAWGCKAVRRTDALTGYDASLNYLWLYRHGDRRQLVSVAKETGAPFSAVPIYERANNVAGLAVMLRWIDTLKAGIGRVAFFHCDPHEVFDVAPVYAPAFFPDPGLAENAGLIFGNFLHHKGMLDFNGNKLQFRSYETLAQDFQGMDVAEEGGAMVLRGSGALTALTTNLTSFADHADPQRNFPIALETLNTGVGNFQVYFAEDFTEVFNNGADPATELGPVTVANERMAYASLIDEKPALAIYKDTLSQVLSLRNFGSADYLGTDQETNAMTIPERRLTLTPLGARLLFTERVDLSATVPDPTITPDLYDPLNVVSDDGAMALKRSVEFSGYGWGSWDNPAFLSPRVKREYLTITDEFVLGPANRLEIHPHLTGELGAVDGADIGVVKLTSLKTDIGFLCPMSRDGNGINYSLWAHPDKLFSQGVTMPKCPCLCEHFNAIAAAINSVKRVTPPDFSSYFIVHHDPFGGPDKTIPITPTLVGTIPREAFYVGVAGDPLITFFRTHGVPIRLMSDFPSDYAAAAAAGPGGQYVNVDIAITVLEVKDLTPHGTGLHRFRVTTRQDFASVDGPHATVGPVDPGGSYDLDGIGAVGGYGPSLVRGAEWVKIEDVKTLAETLGWLFVYQAASIPVALQAFVVGFDRALDQGPAEQRQAVGFATQGVDIIPAVGDVTAGVLAFAYPSRRFAYIENADGEWKAFPLNQSFAVIDAKPGDSVCGQSSSAAPVFGVKWSVDAEWRRLNWGVTASAGIEHRTMFLLQNYSSIAAATPQDGPLALRVPIAYAEHKYDDFTGQSFANAALLAPVIEADGEVFLPLQAMPKAGDWKVVFCGDEENVIEKEDDSGFQVVPMARHLVNAE